MTTIALFCRHLEFYYASDRRKVTKNNIFKPILNAQFMKTKFVTQSKKSNKTLSHLFQLHTIRVQIKKKQKNLTIRNLIHNGCTDF